MTGSASHAGSSASDAVKKGFGLVHGTGEAIRGNFNAALDGATGDRGSAQKNEAIANKGIDEMDHGYHHQHGTGAGVTPVDTESAHGTSTGPLGSGSDLRHTQNDGAGSANFGPHQSSIANKLDPHVDSDADHRGHSGSIMNAQGSTNAGPHATNLGNALDPNVDSNRNHRGDPHSVFAGQGSTNFGPHASNLANKLDPRIDSDRDHRGAQHSGVHTGVVHAQGHHASGLANNADAHASNLASAAQSHAESVEHKAKGTNDASRLEHVAHEQFQAGPHSYDDQEVGFSSSAQHLEPSGSHHEHAADIGHSTGQQGMDVTSVTKGPHSSKLMNKLDPRYDSSTGAKRF